MFKSNSQSAAFGLKIILSLRLVPLFILCYLRALFASFLAIRNGFQRDSLHIFKKSNTKSAK